MDSQILTDAFIDILGKEYVITDPAYIQLAEQTTYNTSQRIILTILPNSLDKLKECVDFARKNNLAIYVVSLGKNWGYGSRVPVAENSILIELKNLNQVLDYSEKYGYITVEPGVTFNQAFDFLREKQSELILNVTGGGGDSSLIGNVLERGIGTGLYADRFNFVCGLEILLPNGDIIATGFEKFDDKQTGKLYRWGSGPYIDGLFSQSNLGIVLKMTIWLLKVPQHLSIAFYKLSNKNLLPLIDKLQELAMEGLIRPTFTLYNDVRVITSLIQYPFNQYDPNQIDSDSLMEEIRQSVPALGDMVGDWNGEISFRSINEEQADVQRRIIQEELRELTDEMSVINLSKEEIMMNFSQHYLSTNKNLSQPSLKAFLLKKYTGLPDNTAVRQTYWRKRKPIPESLDPDRDRCGMIWICPIIPFSGNDALQAVEIIKTTITKYHFEPAISFQFTSERCINIIASFNWDRDVQEEDQTALDCYSDVNRLLFQMGYFSYRNTTISHRSKKETSTDKFLATLKNIIDPSNILSPGRYINDVH